MVNICSSHSNACYLAAVDGHKCIDCSGKWVFKHRKPLKMAHIVVSFVPSLVAHCHKFRVDITISMQSSCPKWMDANSSSYKRKSNFKVGVRINCLASNAWNCRKTIAKNVNIRREHMNVFGGAICNHHKSDTRTYEECVAVLL